MRMVSVCVYDVGRAGLLLGGEGGRGGSMEAFGLLANNRNQSSAVQSPWPVPF